MSVISNIIPQIMVMHKSNQVSNVVLYGTPIVSLYIEGQERLCLAQISNTLLKQFSYNEIHNRRVALGITCVQCTPVQLEILRRAGAMPVSSRRCGMITRREAERLCKSFLGDNAPPRLPDDFAFCVYHKCAWGCRGAFLPSRYNSSRAKCIKCNYCGLFFSPNKFIFHSHRVNSNNKYVQPDAANFNSWRRHMMLVGQPSEEIVHAWEDVKAMFNGGTRKRLINACLNSSVVADSTVACDSGTLSEDDMKNNDQPIKALDDAVTATQTQRNKKDLHNVTSTNENTTKPDTTSVGIVRHPSATSTCKKLYADPEHTGIPFPQNLVMDYMWQAQMHNEIHHSSFQRIKNANTMHSLPFSLLKAESNLYNSPILLNSASQVGEISCQNRIEALHSNITNSNVGFLDIKSSKLAIHGTSAFKPVLQQNQEHGLLAIRVPSSEMAGSVFFTPLIKNGSISSSNTMLTNSSLSSAMSTLFSNSNAGTELTFTANKESLAVKLHTNVNCNSPEIRLNPSIYSFPTMSQKCTKNQIDELITNSNDSDNEDEMVDIETTEDDTVIEKVSITQTKQQISHDSVVLFTKVENESLSSECLILNKNEEYIPKYFQPDLPSIKNTAVIKTKNKSHPCEQCRPDQITINGCTNSNKNNMEDLLPASNTVDVYGISDNNLVPGKRDIYN